MLQFEDSLLELVSFLFFLFESGSEGGDLGVKFLHFLLPGLLFEVISGPLLVKEELFVLDLQLFQLVLRPEELLLQTAYFTFCLHHVGSLALMLEAESLQLALELESLLSLDD